MEIETSHHHCLFGLYSLFAKKTFYLFARSKKEFRAIIWSYSVGISQLLDNCNIEFGNWWAIKVHHILTFSYQLTSYCNIRITSSPSLLSAYLSHFWTSVLNLSPLSDFAKYRWSVRIGQSNRQFLCRFADDESAQRQTREDKAEMQRDACALQQDWKRWGDGIAAEHEWII